MRSWEYVHRRIAGHGADSQDRMDQGTGIASGNEQWVKTERTEF
jgi:hypothetical protein